MRDRGFTLVELLIVISIIGIIAAIVLGSLNSARDKGRRSIARQTLSQIERAMFVLYDDTGFYPSGVADVTDVCINPGANNEIAVNAANTGLVSNGQSWSGWQGPYLSVPLDPWGTPYYFDSDYECQGGEVGCGGTTDTISAILSCGPDMDDAGSGGSCVYNNDNIVRRLCN